jgi:alkylated DNA repair dioxygenase AlkB
VAAGAPADARAPAAEFDVDFNSVLANLYRDGRDRMGWHADNERELARVPVIASLSLGARAGSCSGIVSSHR